MMSDYKKYKVGVTAKEPWANNISYEVLDMTLNAVENGGDGCAYIALKNNIGVRPGTDPTVWVKSTQRGQSIYDYCIEYGLFVGTEEEFAQTYTNAVNGANTAATNANNTNEEVKANERSRVTAENGRVSAESARVSAESSRASAESSRASAESSRASAESSRASAESSRASAESSRVTAESGRVTAEAGRVSAESNRVAVWGGLKTDVENARDQADAAAGRATAAAGVCEEYNAHQPRISETTLCWEVWDADTDQYIDTGVNATNVPYATFDIDVATGQLIMNYEATYAGPEFSLNEANGNIVITI